MTSKPRTIDNLGIETYSQYAKNQATLNPKWVEESRFIPQKAEVSVVKPYLPAELREYLDPLQKTLWASFTPPPYYFIYAKPLFSHQLIPSLGNSEKQEEDLGKLEALQDSLQKAFKEGKQEQHEQQEEEREKKVLLSLLQTIGKLDRTLSLINARRNQYQRG